MKSIFTFIVLFILTSISKISSAQNLEVESIKKSFDSYKNAILNDKGKEAVKYVDSKTIKYYSEILELIKSADSTKIESLSITDKLMVLIIRHRTTKKEILSFDGKMLLIYSIDKGMVGKQGAANNTIGEVTIEDNFAKGQLVVRGEVTPVYYHFNKESEQWGIDLTALFELSDMVFKSFIKDSQLSDNDFIFSILERMTGKRPGQEIWNKVE